RRPSSSPSPYQNLLSRSPKGGTNLVYQLVAALGAEEAERRFVRLQDHLSHPPSFTTVRVNTKQTTVENVMRLLGYEIHK
ncbi:hypothetical protein GDO81_021588, partial [Engystomops pustulosus]